MEQEKQGETDGEGQVPEVVCSGCGRTVKCIKVSDGTVYRPIAWTYPDQAQPLVGICAWCTPIEVRSAGHGATFTSAAGSR